MDGREIRRRKFVEKKKNKMKKKKQNERKMKRFYCKI